MFIAQLILFVFSSFFLSTRAQNSSVTPSFQASPAESQNIPYLLQTANQTTLKNSSQDASATFLIGINSTIYASIYSNWPDAYFFLADMDIDCDGTDYLCPGNTDGQGQTTWGNLSAFQTPYIVVPDSFVSDKSIPANAITAVICAGQMFYAILGDTNGDTPEVIGEASWLMGQTCFPAEGLNGGKGHANTDVLYIVFMTGFPGVNQTQITDYSGLKALGEQKVASLVTALNATNGTGTESSGGSSVHVNPILLLFVVSVLTIISFC